MKQLTEAKKVTLSNACGRDYTTMRQQFEVEPTDVGIKRDHYQGHNHKSYTFTRADVGRTIETMSAIGYACWHFIN